MKWTLFLFLFLLTACTTANDVAMAEAQAAIEAAKAGQLLAGGLAATATINAWTILLPVLALVVVVILWAVDRYQTRKLLAQIASQQRQPAPAPRPQFQRQTRPALTNGSQYLTPEEQAMIYRMRAANLQMPPQQPVEYVEDVDVWGGR